MYILLNVESGHAPLSPIPKNFRIDQSCTIKMQIISNVVTYVCDNIYL